MLSLTCESRQLGWPRTACAALAFCALFALLVGRIWWFGEASTWAGFIRATLFLCLALSLLDASVFRQWLKQNYLLWAAAALLAYIAVSSIWLGDGKTMRRVVLVSAFFIALAHAAHQRQSHWAGLISATGIASVMACAVTLWELWHAGSLDLGNRAAAISDSGIKGLAEFENSVLASLQMAFSLVLIVWLYLIAQRRSIQCFWLLCAVVTSVYVFGTLGRSGWLAAALAVIVLVTVLATKQQRYAFWGSVLVTATLAVVFFHERIAYELFTRQLTHRDEIWRMVFGLMPDRWLLGYGADASIEPLLGVRKLGGYDAVINHAHSLYVEVIFNYGLLGLAAFLAILAGSIRRLWLCRKDPLSALWLSILCGAAAAIGVDFSSFLSTPNLVWLWVWLPVAFACALPSAPLRSGSKQFKAGDQGAAAC